MSDDDRITNYICQHERHVRKLPDSCSGCCASSLACRASRYLNGNDVYCCPDCSHNGSANG